MEERGKENGERNKKGSLKDNDRYRIRVKQPILGGGVSSGCSVGPD